jgi:mevalonate kinase
MWQAIPRQDIALSVYGQVAGVKVGLGTSAAVTVATLRAALASAGLVRAPAEVAAVARAVHRERQGGQGSGYDVTSIAHGGCIAYHRSPDRGERLDWPHGLAAAAFFTGEAAPTAAALDRLGRIGPALDGIRAAAVELVELWPSAPPVRLLEAIGRCESALEAAAAYEPALLPPAVQRLRQFLHRHGLVARTSGAGGGDCVLGFGAAGAVQAAATAWQSEGGVVVARLPADLAPAEDHAFR